MLVAGLLKTSFTDSREMLQSRPLLLQEGGGGVRPLQNKRGLCLGPQHRCYLDVLKPLFDLLGSKVIVGHQLLALFDGLLQVGGSPAHLVFEGFVLTQQPHSTRQILPIILGGEDLLFLSDPTLLQKQNRQRIRSASVSPLFFTSNGLMP